MNRGLGHVQTPRDPRDWHITGLLGAAPNDFATSIDLSPRIDAIRDQGLTESCVAFTLSSCMQLRAAVSGSPIPRPSEMAIYALGRSRPLADVGSSPRQVASALISYGVVPEERWPFDPSLINAIPPWDVLQHGADARLSAFYFLDDNPSYRAAQVKHALNAGYPIGFAQQIAQDFNDYRGGVLDQPSGKILGGHYTMIVGYEVTSSGVVYLAANSWSENWGEGRGSFAGGFYRFSEARLTSSIVSDVCVFTVAPKGQS